MASNLENADILKDFETQVRRAKWFKDELEKQEGWTQRFNKIGEYNSWSKTFPNDEVPAKTLFRFENLQLSAEKFAEILHPSKLDIRLKWDKTFTGTEKLETLSDESAIVFTVVQLPWPFTSRDMVLHLSTAKGIDWFGSKAFAIFVNNAKHALKPPRGDGMVRATNGGNFYIAVQDKEEPEVRCEVFGLTNNNYNGWLPKKMNGFFRQGRRKFSMRLEKA
ncbi:uncharacterized protein LOC124449263 [Xenia sp. Carnegie-2017]|uniref:uncharacterized protein LOC124449263 n=1 Tax=Xenia sp. Carnegie-2017 TaxID=2897299 RepID=UPI001F034A12|nr:uncharacterized protein LOC124449263 [Xenia sp. Carnegie-2017]